MAKIGIFDSGLGGLTVLSAALRQTPHHDYIYLADSANAPYGEKSPEWLESRSHLLCTWLAEQGCDAIVVACNTATTGAIASIRKAFPDIPVIGVEPGIKPAAMTTQTKVVGVLATQNTLASDKFKALLGTLPADCQFIQQAGLGLVPLIEDGALSSPEIKKLLKEYITPMLESGADTLVLGCTHYPFLIPCISELFGNQLKIVDTSDAIVRQIQRFIPDENPEDEMQQITLRKQHQIYLYSTKDGDQLLTHAHNLINLRDINIAIQGLTISL